MSEEETERRIELAMKVSALDERSKANQRQMDRLETIVTQHAKDETAVFTSIRDSIIEVHDKFESKVTTEIAPVKDEISMMQEKIEEINKTISKVTGGWMVIVFIGTSAFGVISFVLQAIKFFSKSSGL